MIVVIAIGGSIIAPNLHSKSFKEYAKAIKEIAAQHKVFITVGGGAMAREYIRIARNLGANEAFCDLIGIDLTRLNARLLISALSEDAYPIPPLDYKEAESFASSEKIVVMGGVIPGQTTDATAAILSEFVKADLFVNATSVDGVYTSDPRVEPSAKKLDKITPEQLVEIVMKSEMKAGAESVIDPLAAKIIERSKIPTIVLNGTDPKNIVDAVIKNYHFGTEIISSYNK
ncbi:MAG: UMP kinase [Methanocellales archaeon]|nr:UMP kinase [Methanocellales archaeon]